MKQLPNRQSIRIRGFDYADSGSYFITICSHGFKHYFGDINNDKMNLNAAGCLVHKEWRNLEKRFPQVILNEFIVMPNHIHGIIDIQNPFPVGAHPCDRPCLDSFSHSTGEHEVSPLRVKTSHQVKPSGTKQGTIGRIVQAFKSKVTLEYIKNVQCNSWKPFLGKLWQRNYYEHIIHDERDYEEISEYIIYNPVQWQNDKDNRYRWHR